MLFRSALKYDPETMKAPQVVAKGRNLIALNIRVLAEKHQVPILEQPPLARSLYRYAELEQEIPSGLYAAVAEVLAYIYQLRAYESGEGGLPALPSEVLVPSPLQVAESDIPEGLEERSTEALIEVVRV